ncbi:hypothetical protein QBC47DRAFT_111896 [Echria macrotheca]|uniref:Uncharacterized protein n=1 Tax=Echria macrotheca TaxID=438768 RepID=A0AAJ0BKH0_9PEZI|nr:hypothetical protein QBC47DRAFT_111896 [Echria macrotheca]
MKWSRNPFFPPAPSAAPITAPSREEEDTASSTNSTNSDPDPENPSPPPPSGPGPGPGPSSPPSPSPSSPSSSTRPATAPTPQTSPVHLQRPTTKLTTHQLFYIFILDGLGAAILSGGINFAIAYAMYTSPSSSPILLWQLPNTLAGDAAVTIILQSIITWLVELVLVNRDLSRGSVAPIGFIPPPSPSWIYLRRFLFLDRHHHEEHQNEGVGGMGRIKGWVNFLASQVIRALVVAVGMFVLLWPASVGILMVLGEKAGGDWEFERVWTPEVFKLVLGAVLGLVETPVFAGFWLVRAGWALRTNQVF